MAAKVNTHYLAVVLTASVTISRRGVIAAAGSSGQQCRSIGHPTFGYICRVTGPVSALDKRGYLIDHMDLDAEVRASFARIPMPSCEIAASAVAAVVHGLVPKATKIKVDLWPILDRPKGTPSPVPAYTSVEWNLTPAV